ncbi:hypothetical protein [Desulfoferula mesophila]|uniref:Uncharacterized protein n=1 Tax=Desulfoferula mesophila TaxID=3058419 RepID=A0AAU9F5H6_9BACT|nr:hypothetical protein FAK_40580 [Desulfoferula mesophilus]
MRAAFTLTPAESRRLIAKAVVELEEVRHAVHDAYVIISGGTTNGYIAQELAGAKNLEPQKFTAGTNTHRLLCVTDENKRTPFPIILHKGQVVAKTTPEVFQDFNVNTVIIKGANAIDPDWNVGVVVAGFDGGTMGKTMGTVQSQGLRYIVPVGLEKMVPSVHAAAAAVGAKRLDYCLGADFGMVIMPNAVVVTELESLEVLCGVEATHVASGGVGESAGSVVLVVEGNKPDVEAAIKLVEGIKGEPVLPGFKGTCKSCRYACRFRGTELADLPAWLTD